MPSKEALQKDFKLNRKLCLKTVLCYQQMQISVIDLLMDSQVKYMILKQIWGTVTKLYVKGDNNAAGFKTI